MCHANVQARVKVVTHTTVWWKVLMAFLHNLSCMYCYIRCICNRAIQQVRALTCMYCYVYATELYTHFRWAAATHKLCHGGLAGWRDVLQELQSVVGPAVDDMHSYSVVHVVLQWSIAPGGGHIRTHGVSTIAV